MRLAATLAMFSLFLSFGCANSNSKPEGPQQEDAGSDRWRVTDEAVVDALHRNINASTSRPIDPGGGGGVSHVVLVWLKTPGDTVEVDKIIQASREFQRIPGVVAVHAGRPLPSTRPTVDDSFDVGVVIRFRDQAALAGYDQHPAHVRAVREVLGPAAAKVLIYDIVTPSR